MLAEFKLQLAKEINPQDDNVTVVSEGMFLFTSFQNPDDMFLFCDGSTVYFSEAQTVQVNIFKNVDPGSRCSTATKKITNKNSIPDKITQVHSPPSQSAQ